MAHEAAMLAARQGKFWEMTAYLLDTAQQGQPLREQDLIAFAAGKLGLDATAFAADLQVHRYSPRVEADLAEGLKRGIRGSPAIVVNGRGRIDGVPSLDTLAQLINEETQKVAAAK
jgi:predicted DsbA family dithiol-disulfide isomerase